MSASSPKFRTRIYSLWSLDVWGNPKDGFEVNDRCRIGTIRIRCRKRIYNQGTTMEFSTFNPTDLQLSRAVGVHKCVWDGEPDGSLFCNSKRNFKPVCQLEFEEIIP